MCRLYQIKHSKCGHLHHYEPINPCEAGFSHELEKCLAEPTTSPEYGNTIPLFDHPYCKECIRLGKYEENVDDMRDEIRNHYVHEELRIISERKAWGQSYQDMNDEVLMIRAKRKKEIKALQAYTRPEYSDDTSSGETVAISALGKRIATWRLEERQENQDGPLD